MLQLYLKGGFLMHPILLASILALAIALERWRYFRKTRPRKIGRQFEIIEAHLLSGRENEAWAVAARISGPIGSVLSEALEGTEEDPDLKEEKMAIRGEEILREAARGLSVLGLIASVSTMLGLLGTVVGLVEAFQRVAELEERVSPAHLASGIWVALITTVAGLFVAIPTLIAHHLLQLRHSQLAFQIEHYGNRLLLLLRKKKTVNHAPSQVLSE